VRFFTNTDSLAAASLLSRLQGYRLPVGAAELFTPVVAARNILAGSVDARALLLVNDQVGGELASACAVQPWERAEDATHVVIGDFRDGLSYVALDAAFRAVRAGAQLLALQMGRYFRAADGVHLDTGAVVAAVEYAADVPARVLGKPSPEFLALALASVPLTFAPDQVWVVGDDRATDIAMGNAAGMVTAQPRTGKYADQAERRDLAVPRHVIDSISALPGLIGALESDRKT
jgi:ribonucleotide monophosphatase NagD (HAD superfamily)